MNIIESIQEKDKTAFSFEILPPIKGKGTKALFETVERLSAFNPKYINITTHRSEYIYQVQTDSSYKRERIQRRPGTIGVAAALQNRFGLPTVPHLLCSGYSVFDTEQILLDLQYLGIDNILVLRGDKAPDARSFQAEKDGFSHAIDLQKYVNTYNNGFFANGNKMDNNDGAPFYYGVACYPEKHGESPNLEQDIYWFKEKVKNGASYGVTQLFYDNQKYFDFVKLCRAEGINVPIIPGIKPLTRIKQLNTLPRIFGIDIPDEFVRKLVSAKTDKEVAKVGIDWCVRQCQELIEFGVPSIHFYSMGQAHDVCEVAEKIYK